MGIGVVHGKKISSIFNNTLKRASAFRCAANSAGIRVVAAHVREEMTEMVFGEILILRLAKRFFLKRDTIDHSCQINSRVRMRMNWIINPIFGFRHFQFSHVSQCSDLLRLQICLRFQISLAF